MILSGMGTRGKLVAAGQPTVHVRSWKVGGVVAVGEGGGSDRGRGLDGNDRCGGGREGGRGMNDGGG